VNEIHARHGLGGVLGDGEAGAGAPGDVLGKLDDVLGRVQLGGAGQVTWAVQVPIQAPDRRDGAGTGQ